MECFDFCPRRHAIRFAAIAIALLLQSPCFAQERAEWMKQARFGVMNHYLADWIARRENFNNGQMTVERWNELIDHVDADALAEQVKSVGAAYEIFTIGQNSGYFDSPNATYDRIVGISPSHCSERDLIADLAAALHRRGLKLIAYLPAGAPGGDRIAREKLRWQIGPHSNREFQLAWERIIREWSTRWGDKVDGWWFDGCYWPNAMYRGKDLPNFESFSAAARAGNPKSIVAFNPGVVYRTISITPFEDYSAGEIDLTERWLPRRVFDGKADGAQVHVLTYLGQKWGTGDSPRMTSDEAIAFTRKVFDAGGAITWDVPIQNNGTIPANFIEPLRAIGKSIHDLPATRAATRPTGDGGD